MLVEKVPPKTKTYYCEQVHVYPFFKDRLTFQRFWLTKSHVFAAHGILMLFNTDPYLVMKYTLLIIGVGRLMGIGLNMGCHRYWAHKSFKAKLPLEILMAFFQVMAAQDTIFKWSRDHRLHHKYTETDADPYNAKKGFWFAHMTWLYKKEHPSVLEKEATIDLSDLDNDPVVRFQAKYYWHIGLFARYIVPMYFLHWCFPMESFYRVWIGNYVWYVGSLHCTWLVNSAAHLFGDKPYDKKIFARENKLVAMIAIGEGWHNYHHTFPWDYKSSELSFYKYNVTTLFIDMFAKIGWAYDLKTVSDSVIRDRAKRTGDGTHEVYGKDEFPQIENSKPKVLPSWGWGHLDCPQDFSKAR